VIAKVSLTRFALTALVSLLVLAPSALAGGGKGGGGTTSSSTIRLVLLDSTDGTAHFGQHVTFAVSTTATTRPFVSLNCYQGGSWVYTASVGFFADYAWPQQFTLSSGWWTSGAADCTAALYYTNSSGTRNTTLATLSFRVNA